MTKTNKILTVILLISSLFLGIGYAAIENITLDIAGTATAVPTNRILVTGENFNKMVKGSTTLVIDTTVTKIVFDYWENGYYDDGIQLYNNADWEIGTPIDADGLGGIRLFKSSDGTKIYILSETTIYANANLTRMFYRFENVSDIIFNNFNTKNVTTLEETFRYCGTLEKLDLSNFDTSKTTVLYGTFADCHKLAEIDLSSFNTKNVSITAAMFHACHSLSELDLSNFNTANVTQMWNMFSYCHAMKSLDISNFDTSKVTSLHWMFGESYNLVTIYVGDKWNTAKVTSSDNMFNNCTSLIGGAGTTFNSAYADKTYARVDGGPNSETPGYLTLKSSN